MQNTPRLNGGRDFASSPSASSVSQHGPGSSCGTSPEPMSLGNSNEQNTISEEGLITIALNGDRYVCKSGSLDGETETTFCEKLGMACGNPHNPIPKAAQLNGINPNAAAPNSLDWLTQQNGGNFDPVLFADYRDPVNEINAGINMSFFDDAFPMTTSFADIESPFRSSLQKKDLVLETDRAENGDDDEDEVVPADDPRKMLSCNKIWYVFHSNFLSQKTPSLPKKRPWWLRLTQRDDDGRDRISSHPKFVSGELDMDDLCSELRHKAKCSETGVVVSESDVREVLTKVGVGSIDFL